jgi:hypothetical protein
MASSSSGSSGSDNGSSRSASRRLSGLSPEKGGRQQCHLTSLRKKYCTQWNLPPKLVCSGCTFYLQATQGKPPTGRPRSETHGRTPKYECKRPWQNACQQEDKSSDLDDGVYRFNATDSWAVDVTTWIEEKEKCNLSRVQRKSKATPASATHSATKRALLDGDDGAVVVVEEQETDGRKKKKVKEDIKLNDVSINSQGHSFEVLAVPISHVLVRKNRLARLVNTDNKVKAMLGSLSGDRFTKNAGQFTRTLLAVCVSSAPCLPLSQAANMMPLFVGAFLSEYGLLDEDSFTHFARSFPSEAYFRDLMFSFAAENLLELGEKLKGKLVFLSCDKGSKKGIGHFVKVLSWFDGTRVQKQILDIDASEGSTDLCANAIRASLQKVGVTKLHGQTTDSGGGGVLTGLATALRARNLCHDNYLVASCSLHNLQLTLARPVKETMGEGGLDKRNVMQLLHAVYDLQDSMSQDVWKVLTTEAVLFTNAYCTAANTYTGITIPDQQFAVKWNKVRGFRNFEEGLPDWKERRMTCKFPAPVLTRWWTVGEGARAVMDCYLVLLKISQSVINSTSGKCNKIASGLQPLLLEPELYSDLALVHCYHSSYVCVHFKWMQECTDLSDVPGFQAHNTLVRYYIIQDQLQSYKTSILGDNYSYAPFRRSLQNLDPQRAARQQAKVDTFITLALESCHKHFARWMSKELLPAALLAEKEFAVIIAKTMKKEELPEFNRLFGSDVHGKLVDLDSFAAFVTAGVDATNIYDPLALHVAGMVTASDDVDMRDITEGPSCFYKLWTYSAYLPLASSWKQE